MWDYHVSWRKTVGNFDLYLLSQSTLPSRPWLIELLRHSMPNIIVTWLLSNLAGLQILCTPYRFLVFFGNFRIFPGFFYRKEISGTLRIFFPDFFRVISGLFPDCSGFPFFIRKSVLLIGRAKVLHALWVTFSWNSPSLRGRAKVLHALWVISKFSPWNDEIRYKYGTKPILLQNCLVPTCPILFKLVWTCQDLQIWC